MLAEKVAGHELVGDAEGGRGRGDPLGLWGADGGGVWCVWWSTILRQRRRTGAGFGMALSSLTHGTVLPAMGLSAEPEEQTARERTSEMATHVVYGVVTETVRRVVRRMLG